MTQEEEKALWGMLELLIGRATNVYLLTAPDVSATLGSRKAAAIADAAKLAAGHIKAEFRKSKQEEMTPWGRRHR